MTRHRMQRVHFSEGKGVACKMRKPKLAASSPEMVTCCSCIRAAGLRSVRFSRGRKLLPHDTAHKGKRGRGL